MQKTSESDEYFNINRYFGLILSNWYWFTLALFISGLLAYGINHYSEKNYTVTASLMIKDDQNSDLSGLDRLMPGGDIFRSQQNLQNEIGILKSYDVNLKVMQNLPDFHVTVVGIGRRGIAQVRHYKTAPFIIQYDSLNSQEIGVPINLRIRSALTYSLDIEGVSLSKKEFSFGERIEEAGFNFRIIAKDSSEFRFDDRLSNRYRFTFNSPEALANQYRTKLKIQPINEESSLIVLSVTGPVKLQEADYLNKLMTVYDEKGLEFKKETAEKTLEFIDTQLGRISDSLKIAENRLEKFRLENRVLDLSSEGAAIKSRLEDYLKEQISASLQEQYFNYLSDYINNRNESGTIISPSIMGVTDPLLIELVDQLSKLQTQKNQLRFDFSEQQPAINLINSKIEDSRVAISENVKNNLANIKRTVADINSRISAVENELSKLPSTEKKLVNIQRTFDLNNTVYTYMLEKRSEAGIAKASQTSGIRIIDTAIPNNSSLVSPRTKRNYLIAIILGLLVPGIYIILVDQMHNKIIDKKDIERGTDVPIIGFVGHNNSKNEIPVIEKPGSSISESFRSIRTNLKYYIPNNKAVISVTSTLSGEGKTFISMNLAVALAILNKKTLIIGVDLRKPRLNRILNSVGTTGLSTYLIGEAEYSQIINKTEIENLYFVPSGAIPPNPAELLESEKMKQFIQLVKDDFDYIVLDTPPVGIVSDALLLGSYSDVNIFVIRQRFSFKNTLELIQNIYIKKELKNLTIAVNDIHTSGYYGYGLRYGYGFYEGYGYNYGYRQYGSYNSGGYNSYYTED